MSVLSGTFCLRCNEGINVTLFGIPMYYWNETECLGKSNCFTQEIGLKLDTPVMMRYGGCISRGYSNLFTCKKLFGKESTLNPSILLNLVTDSDDLFDRMTKNIRKQPGKYIHQLFSKGVGVEEFVEGIMVMQEAAGFNMKKAKKLTKPIADLLSVIVDVPTTFAQAQRYLNNVEKQRDILLTAIGNLGTKNQTTTNRIYSFIKGVTSQSVTDNIKASKGRVLIENLPGLFRSMVSTDERDAYWYDVMIKMASKINMKDMRQSIVDILFVVKGAMNIPEITKTTVVDPIFETIPDCVVSLSTPPVQHNQIVNDCGIEILKKFSSQNQVTTGLSTAIRRFYRTAMPSSMLDQYPSDFIQWFPGLFYRFFPASKSDIDNAYNSLKDGFESFDFTDLSSSTRLERTKMSDFLLNMVRSLKPDMETTDETFIINFSKTFYNVMTEKYEDKLDKSFTTMISGFSTFPKIDSGLILKNLFKNYDQEVPKNLEPFLNNLQSIIDCFQKQKNWGMQLLGSLKNMTQDYGRVYPNSKFPALAIQYIEILKELASVRPVNPCQFDLNNPHDVNYYHCIESFYTNFTLKLLKLSKKENKVDVKFYFAILEALGVTSNDYIDAMKAKNETFLATYARLMKELDPEDVIELMNDYSLWMSNIFMEPDNYKFDYFMHAINLTTAKILGKLSDVMKDLRHVHAPESCRHVGCSENLCNTHSLINSVKPIKKSSLRGETPYDSDDSEDSADPSSEALAAKPRIFLLLAAILVVVNYRKL